MEVLWVLVIVGILLITAEFFVPGGILATVGVICLIASFVLAFRELGGLLGSLFMLGTLAVSVLAIIVEIKLLKNSPMAKTFFLEASISRNHDENNTNEITGELVGKSAVAISNLAPQGLVEIEGSSYEAVSEDGLIEKGDDLKVVRQGKFRLYVRRG